MLTNLQYRILKSVFSAGSGNTKVYEGKSKLAVLFGADFCSKTAGKIIIDFGCGDGTGAVEIAAKGACRVIGVDILDDRLQVARQKATEAGVHDICLFARSTTERADFLVSVDAFEHFADPAGVLRTMSSLLKKGGEVHACFGPTWFNPFGGHLFSVFPWAHLLFSEKALILWRSHFRDDGATRFSEVAGGLNKMTIARFEELVANSPFKFANLELVPIKKLRYLHNRLTREFTTSVVRCRLVKR